MKEIRKWIEIYAGRVKEREGYTAVHYEIDRHKVVEEKLLLKIEEILQNYYDTGKFECYLCDGTGGEETECKLCLGTGEDASGLRSYWELLGKCKNRFLIEEKRELTKRKKVLLIKSIFVLKN